MVVDISCRVVLTSKVLHVQVLFRFKCESTQIWDNKEYPSLQPFKHIFQIFKGRMKISLNQCYVNCKTHGKIKLPLNPCKQNKFLLHYKINKLYNLTPAVNPYKEKQQNVLFPFKIFNFHYLFNVLCFLFYIQYTYTVFFFWKTLEFILTWICFVNPSLSLVKSDISIKFVKHENPFSNNIESSHTYIFMSDFTINLQRENYISFPVQT